MLLAHRGEGLQCRFIGAEEGVLQPQLSRERAQLLVPRAATSSLSGHWGHRRACGHAPRALARRPARGTLYSGILRAVRALPPLAVHGRDPNYHPTQFTPPDTV